MGKDKLYETMKVVAKQRKMKASPQHDLYKKDGLYFYRKIAMESPSYLKAGGRLYLEIGYDQGLSVPKLLEEQGFCEIEVKKDLAGHDRVVKGTYPGYYETGMEEQNV